MRVTQIMSRQQYWDDARFVRKRPNLRGTKKHASGDNIYRWNALTKRWEQLDSYHSNPDGSPHAEHVLRDTRVDRVLISADFVYFGGHGPKLPPIVRGVIVKHGRGDKVITDVGVIKQFDKWICGLGAKSYAGAPSDWMSKT
jgi:hypothetical protein